MWKKKPFHVKSMNSHAPLSHQQLLFLPIQNCICVFRVQTTAKSVDAFFLRTSSNHWNPVWKNINTSRKKRPFPHKEVIYLSSHLLTEPHTDNGPNPHPRVARNVRSACFVLKVVTYSSEVYRSCADTKYVKNVWTQPSRHYPEHYLERTFC